MKYILIIAIILVFASCKKNNSAENSDNVKNTEKEDSLAINIEHIYDDFDLCLPDSSLIPVLDDIVECSKSCRQLRKKGMIFNFWINNDIDTVTRIKIEMASNKRMHCKGIDRIFIYEGLVFNAISYNELESYFTNTGIKVTFPCLRTNASSAEYYSFIAFWSYVFKDQKATCISYSYCDQTWRDERYNKPGKVE